MEGTRIITLGSQPVNSSVSPQFATFEEAFGEYSELFGKKARARRAKRRKSRREDRSKRRKERLAYRQEKVADKAEARRMRKKTRREARQQERNDRKEARQQMRIERRRKRKAARQNIRAEQQAARMQRRMERKAQKQARKDLEAEREREREDMAMQDYEDQGYDDGGYDDGGYDDGGSDDGGYDDGGYETTDDGGYGDDSGGGYDDDYYDPSDPYGDETGYNPYANTTNSTAYGEYDTGGGGSYGDPSGDQGVYDDGSGNWWQNDDFYGSGSGTDYYPIEGPSDDFSYDVDYGFDGSVDEVLETGPSSFDGPLADGQFDAEMMEGEGMGEYATSGGGSYITKTALADLADYAKRIEWNKENLNKFEGDSSYLGFSGDRDSEMSDNAQREGELKEDIRAWVNFEGDSEYMGADGRYKRIPSRKAIMQRMRAVSRAKMKARKRRPSWIKRMRGRKGMVRPEAIRTRQSIRRAVKSQAKRPNLLVKGGTPAPKGMMGKKIARGTATKVEMGLSPQIEPQRITVPARSKFSGFDAKSNAMRSIPWKEIGIGLAVGVAGIAIYKAVKK